MDRNHAGAEPVRLLGQPLRAPEGIVEDDEIGANPAQGLLRRPGSERHPIAVRGHQAQPAKLVQPADVSLTPSRNQQVVLDRLRAGGEPGALVEIGANPAAALAVEEGDVGDHERAWL